MKTSAKDTFYKGGEHADSSVETVEGLLLNDLGLDLFQEFRMIPLYYFQIFFKNAHPSLLRSRLSRVIAASCNMGNTTLFLRKVIDGHDRAISQLDRGGIA